MGLVWEFLKTYRFYYQTFVASLVIGLKIIEVQTSINIFWSRYDTRPTFKNQLSCLDWRPKCISDWLDKEIIILSELVFNNLFSRSLCATVRLQISKGGGIYELLHTCTVWSLVMIWVVNIIDEYDIWVIHSSHFINGFWSSSSFSLESKYRIIGKLEVPKNSNTTATISKTSGQVFKIVCSNVTETF